MPDLKTAFKTRQMEHKSNEERLRELGRSSLEKKMRRGDMIAPFKYLQGCHVEEGKNLFSAAPESSLT